MNGRIDKWLEYNYPQNYILKNPFKGTLILSIFIFGFFSLYKPFNTHAAGAFSFETTMALYGFLSAIIIFLALKILKTFRYFSNSKDWTILKEFLSVLFILFVTGIALYVLGFLIEGPHNRWNILTFLGSLEIAFLTGIIPLTFFTAINFRYLSSPLIRYNETETALAGLRDRVPEDLIRISSLLKKEDLSFYPSQFIYCVAYGNYVVFHLIINEQYIKKTIRNSINSIEQQLTRIPSILRIHRAFIVNLKMVSSKRGNTMGYQLKFNNIDAEVPVSRNNTKKFDQKINQFR
jgi:hypothetical protein